MQFWLLSILTRFIHPFGVIIITPKCTIPLPTFPILIEEIWKQKEEASFSYHGWINKRTMNKEKPTKISHPNEIKGK